MNKQELEKIKEKALKDHIPIIMDDTVMITHPTTQQLSDKIALFKKFSLRSLSPFIISFLNIKIIIMMYIKSVNANKKILGVLGILLTLIPKDDMKAIIKLL